METFVRLQAAHGSGAQVCQKMCDSARKGGRRGSQVLEMIVRERRRRKRGMWTEKTERNMKAKRRSNCPGRDSTNSALDPTAGRLIF